MNKKYDYIYYYNPQNFNRFNKWGAEDWLALGVVTVWIGVILLAIIGVSISIGIFINQLGG